MRLKQYLLMLFILSWVFGVDSKASIKIFESTNHQNFEEDPSSKFPHLTAISDVKIFSYAKPKLKPCTWGDESNFNSTDFVRENEKAFNTTEKVQRNKSICNFVNIVPINRSVRNPKDTVHRKPQNVSKIKPKLSLVQTSITNYLKKRKEIVPITKSKQDYQITTAMSSTEEMSQFAGSSKQRSEPINCISNETNYKVAITNAPNSIISFLSNEENIELRKGSNQMSSSVNQTSSETHYNVSTKHLHSKVKTNAFNSFTSFSSNEEILEFKETNKRTPSPVNWTLNETIYKVSPTNIYSNDKTDILNSFISLSSNEPLDLRMPKENQRDFTKASQEVDYKNVKSRQRLTERTNTQRLLLLGEAAINNPTSIPNCILGNTIFHIGQNENSDSLKHQQFRKHLDIENEILLQQDYAENTKLNKITSDSCANPIERTPKRNPYRLQINNEVPDISVDTNSSASSNVKRMNNDIMNYILNQKCGRCDLNESCDWESFESSILNKTDEGPVLTAEQYKLIFG